MPLGQLLHLLGKRPTSPSRCYILTWRPLQIRLTTVAESNGLNDLNSLMEDLKNPEHAAVRHPVFVQTPKQPPLGLYEFFAGYPLGDELPALERWRPRLWVRRFVQLQDAVMFLAQGWPVVCEGWTGGPNEHKNMPNLQLIPNLQRVLTAPKHADEKPGGSKESGAGAGHGPGGTGAVDTPFNPFPGI